MAPARRRAARARRRRTGTSCWRPLTVIDGRSSQTKRSSAASATSPWTQMPSAGARVISRAARLTASPEAAEGPPLGVAVGPAAQAPGRDAHLDVGDGHLLGDLEQPQGALARAGGVVLVGDGRPEDGVQVGALVADGQLEDVAALLVEGLLGPGDEGVQHIGGLRVALEVEPAEAYEDGNGRAQVGQELAAAGDHPLPDRREQPLAGGLVGQLRPPRRGVGGEHRVDEGVDHPHLAELAGPDLLQLDPVTERREGARVEHHVAGLRTAARRRPTSPSASPRARR